MGSPAERGLRDATENAASASDDIDAGWGEAPTHVPNSASRSAVPEPEQTITTLAPPESVSRKVSVRRTALPSLPPVPIAPRPSPSGRAPRAMSANLSWMERAALFHEQLGLRGPPSVRVRSVPPAVREEPTLTREDPTLPGEGPTLVREDPTLVNEEPTLEVRTDYIDEADIIDVRDIDDVIHELSQDLSGETAQEVRDDELFGGDARTSDFEIPDFRPRSIGRIAVVAAIVAVIGLSVAFVATRPSASRTRPAVAISAPRVPQQPVSQPVPEPRSPEPVAVPTAPANDAMSLAPLELAAPEPSPAKASSITAVTVKVIPSAAVIFRAGEKLGSGSVQLSVARASKQRLTALHDGYLPYNFTVDGSRETVTVRLKRALRPQVVETPVVDASSADSSEDATSPPTPAR